MIDAPDVGGPGAAYRGKLEALFGWGSRNTDARLRTWSLDAKALSILKGPNTRCVCRITGRDEADEFRHPIIDLPPNCKPRARR